MQNTDEQTISYLKRRPTMNEWSARKLIRELEEVIQNLRARLASANRIEKNLLHQQIENRKLQITWANSFIPTR